MENLKIISSSVFHLGIILFLSSVQSFPNGKQQPRCQALPDPAQIFTGINLHPYYSYLYYYPTMQWSLDKTPDTDDYWVGIYNKNEADNRKYLAYRYIKRTAQGSYYIGNLGNTKGFYGCNRYEEYELRIFHGNYQRIDAESNVLRGAVNYSPSNPFAPDAENLISSIQSTELEEFDSLFSGIEEKIGTFHLVEDIRKQWNNFTDIEQELLLPILEQDSLPDSIKYPDAKELNISEPNVRFPYINNVKGVTMNDLDGSDFDQSVTPLQPISSRSPNKIVLTITLEYGYTYVYPRLYVETPVTNTGIRRWMGMYRTQSTTNFDPAGYIDWAYVDFRRVTTLKYIKESAAGPTSTQYVGPVFAWSFQYDAQIGMVATTIEATISVGASLPPAKFEPDYDKETALYFANLSALAYKHYSVVEEQISTFNLKADLQIYDAKTDTNGFVASSSDTVVVAFRGTASFKNILTDLRWIRQPIINGEPFFAQRGFLSAINRVYDTIEAEIRPHIGKKKLYVTGHSLGAALSTLFGFKISLKYDKAQPSQYVYGCPPVGDIYLAHYFRGMDSNTITIQGDPVATGILIGLTAWQGYYQPYQVKYLPKAGGHGIANYIEQLENL